MPTDLWSRLTRDVSTAIRQRDNVALDVDRAEAQLCRAEAALEEASDRLRETLLRLHAEFPELWRFGPPTVPTHALCGQCGEQLAAMVKLGVPIADAGWCADCLDGAAEFPVCGNPGPGPGWTCGLPAGHTTYHRRTANPEFIEEDAETIPGAVLDQLTSIDVSGLTRLYIAAWPDQPDRPTPLSELGRLGEREAQLRADVDQLRADDHGLAG